MKQFAFIGLLAIASFAGCETQTERDQDAAAKVTASELFGDPTDRRFKLSVFFNNNDSEEPIPTDVRSFDEPTVKIIREQFESLEWENPLHSIDIAVAQGGRFFPNHHILAIAGTLNATGEQKPLVATLREQKDGVVVKDLQSEILDSRTTAVDLLVSFFKQDGEYLDDVKWEPKN